MTLSKERLTSIAVAPGLEPCDYEETYSSITTGEIQAMARELLDRRERDKQEPVAWVMVDDLSDSAIVSTPAYPNIDDAKDMTVGEIVPLYAAPPAPVVPTFEEWCQRNEQKPVGWVRDAMKEAYDGCRTSALDQTHVKQPASNGQSFGNSEQLNSPAVPDGWAVVPIEPTDEMLHALYHLGPRLVKPCETGLYRAMLAAAPKQESE